MFYFSKTFKRICIILFWVYSDIKHLFFKLWGKRHAHQPVMHRTGPIFPGFLLAFELLSELCALGPESILVCKNSDGPTELFSHYTRNFTAQCLTRRDQSCLCFSTVYVLKIYRWLIKSKSSLSSNKSKRNELLGNILKFLYAILFHRHVQPFWCLPWLCLNKDIFSSIVNSSLSMKAVFHCFIIFVYLS